MCVLANVKCESDKFPCADKTGCLEVDKVCDNLKQCQDGSDEVNCEGQLSSCNFKLVYIIAFWSSCENKTSRLAKREGL